jgi:hypothetical protein
VLHNGPTRGGPARHKPAARLIYERAPISCATDSHLDLRVERPSMYCARATRLVGSDCRVIVRYWVHQLPRRAFDAASKGDTGGRTPGNLTGSCRQNTLPYRDAAQEAMFLYIILCRSTRLPGCLQVYRIPRRCPISHRVPSCSPFVLVCSLASIHTVPPHFKSPKLRRVMLSKRIR